MYTLQHSDGVSAPINVAPLTTDLSSTSLSFWGRGVPNFGQMEQTNFLNLLENFASDVEPANPTRGQLWYNTGNFILYVYDPQLVSNTWKWVPVNNFTYASNGHPAIVGNIIGDTQPIKSFDLCYDFINKALYIVLDNTWVPILTTNQSSSSAFNYIPFML